jgi:hypothetical protein
VLVGIAQVFRLLGVESLYWGGIGGFAMSRFFKVLAIVGVLAGAMAATSGTALAQHHRGGGGGGGFHGGGGHWRGGGWRGGGWGPGFGFGLGLGYPYYYGGPYYDGGPGNCGYVRVRVWRSGHWVLRRAYRCW